MTHSLPWLVALLCLLPTLLAWDPKEGDVPWEPEEIALFELVDEVNGTFYELMNISRNATTKEIKDQYKEMAMHLHPDKNPDTEDEFRQLAAVYNILKDKKNRKNYERVLEEGLPDWRMPAFYDRKVQVVRHIGLIEGIITLFVICTIAQYGMHWASYFETKYLGPKVPVKKVKKAKKAPGAAKEAKVVAPKEAEAVSENEADTDLKPSVYDLLPFQLYELCKHIPEVPTYAKEYYEEYQKRKEEDRKEQEELEEEKRKYEERKEEKKRNKEARKRITGESETDGCASST